MARPIVPVPDPATQPFWDACNEGKLIVQYCTMCDRRQYPPEAVCRDCGFNFHLTWEETSGRANIVGYSITYDSRLVQWHPLQPFLNVIVALEEDAVINFHTNMIDDFGSNLGRGARYSYRRDLRGSVRRSRAGPHDPGVEARLKGARCGRAVARRRQQKGTHAYGT